MRIVSLASVFLWSISSAPGAADDRGIKIIGAGLPRTGTTSLDQALGRLGLSSFHSGKEFSTHPWLRWTWRKSLSAHKDWRLNEVDWRLRKSFYELIRSHGFDALLDAPLSLDFELLSHLYPGALVILTVRKSAKDWVESVTKMSWYQNSTCSKYTECPLALKQQRFFRTVYESFGCPVARLGKAREAVRERCAQAYLDYNAAVRRAIPAHRLLVLNVEDGWEPLCQRLRLKVPDLPFPDANKGVGHQLQPLLSQRYVRRDEHGREVAEEESLLLEWFDFGICGGTEGEFSPAELGWLMPKLEWHTREGLATGACNVVDRLSCGMACMWATGCRYFSFSFRDDCKGCFLHRSCQTPNYDAAPTYVVFRMLHDYLNLDDMDHKYKTMTEPSV